MIRSGSNSYSGASEPSSSDELSNSDEPSSSVSPDPPGPAPSRCFCLALRKNSRRPSGVRSCSGSSSPRACPNCSSSASSVALCSARTSRAIRSKSWLVFRLAVAPTRGHSWPAPPARPPPAPVTQPQHLTEQISQRLLMPNDEPRDRRVIRHHVAGDHPVGHILATVTLDRARRADLRRVRIQDERHHHRRLIRRPAVTVSPIRAIERLKVHLRHRVDHEPRQVIGRQPIPHVRRQQETLLTPAFNEVLSHAGIVLNVPDGTPLCDSLVSKRASGSGRHGAAPATRARADGAGAA